MQNEIKSSMREQSFSLLGGSIGEPTAFLGLAYEQRKAHRTSLRCA